MRIAEEAVSVGGARRCMRFQLVIDVVFMLVLTKFSGIEVLKCKEGMNNRAYLITMDDGSVVFAKLPNSNAGPAFYTTASEVATRTFVGMVFILSSDTSYLIGVTTATRCFGYSDPSYNCLVYSKN